MSTLVAIGTGIHVGHMTSDARDWLEHADKVLYHAADAATERLILQLNKNAESLHPFYGEGKRRRETYNGMVDRTLSCLEEFATVVVAYYGHPGFFVDPSHRAIRLARQRGHEAYMLPAVSSFDCLVADLGINVASGCQIFEATDFILRQRHVDIHSHLVLLQVSVLGDLYHSFKGFDRRHMGTLKDYLLEHYPLDHVVTAYHAAQFSVARPRMETLELGTLSRETKGLSTLYVPPVSSAPIHIAAVDRLELRAEIIGEKRLVPLNSELETPKRS